MSLHVTARAREIAVATARSVYDHASRLFADKPSAQAQTALEAAMRAVRAASLLAEGDDVRELEHVDTQIERAAYALHLQREVSEPAPRTTPPATLNGSPVVASRPRGGHEGVGYVVLVHHFGLHPWVTAVWYPTTSTAWTWGNYFRTEEQAREDFAIR